MHSAIICLHILILNHANFHWMYKRKIQDKLFPTHCQHERRKRKITSFSRMKTTPRISCTHCSSSPSPQIVDLRNVVNYLPTHDETLTTSQMLRHTSQRASKQTYNTQDKIQKIKYHMRKISFSHILDKNHFNSHSPISAAQINGVVHHSNSHKYLVQLQIYFKKDISIPFKTVLDHALEEKTRNSLTYKQPTTLKSRLDIVAVTTHRHRLSIRNWSNVATHMHLCSHTHRSI